VCCSLLQCIAVCCSVLQCVAVCCSVLQCVVVLRMIPTSVLQCPVFFEGFNDQKIRTARNTRKRFNSECPVSLGHAVKQDLWNECTNNAAHCSTLQHTATPFECPTLPRSCRKQNLWEECASNLEHCSTLQRTATHCNAFWKEQEKQLSDLWLNSSNWAICD